MSLEEVTVEITPPPAIVVELTSGPQGPAGPPGTDGDLHYTHNQMVALTTWTVTHNLGKVPSVTVIDSAGSVVEGDYSPDPLDSLNKMTLSFSVPFAGKAYFN